MGAPMGAAGEEDEEDANEGGVGRGEGGAGAGLLQQGLPGSRLPD